VLKSINQARGSEAEMEEVVTGPRQASETIKV